MQEPPTDTNYRHAVGVTPLPGNRLTSPCERNNSISRKCCLDCCSAFQCIAVCQSDHYESGGGRQRREVTVRKPTNADWFLFMRTKELFVRRVVKNAYTTLTGVHAAKAVCATVAKHATIHVVDACAAYINSHSM